MFITNRKELSKDTLHQLMRHICTWLLSTAATSLTDDNSNKQCQDAHKYPKATVRAFNSAF